MNYCSLILFGLLLPLSNGFQHVQRNTFLSQRNAASCVSSPSTSVLFHNQRQNSDSAKSSSPVSLISSLFRNARLDTISASGLKNVHTAGPLYMFGIKSVGKLVKKAKTLPQDLQNLTLSDIKPREIIKYFFNPITAFIFNIMLAKKYKTIVKNPVYWIWMTYCVKWYRARYVYKIPVWDRQPNWNNVITSKDQEKDLKAFTCKKCGSTIFIAKSREFFFEGKTGLAGLGCFSCGAKGAENFVMDRERIMEDVADIDDYFEYERPLDFISASERRTLLKETGGDEDEANKLLVERENPQASEESQAAAGAVVNGETDSIDGDDKASDEASVSEEVEESEVVADAQEEDEKEESVEESEPPAKKEIEVVATPKSEKKVTESATSSSKKKKKKKKKPTPSSSDDEDMDILDMDDF